MFEWHTTGVPEGEFVYCLVITRSPYNNKLYCYDACYLNNYAVYDDGDDCTLTGWFSEEGDSDEGYYASLDREVLAWTRLPNGDVVEEFLKELNDR